jgi:signal transduction histidine kinase
MPHRRSGESAAILMVDDIPANLLALTAILEPLGHELVCAHSGAEAVDLALQREFALILMDVQMPMLDGFQTTRLIKRHPEARHVPVIFLTAINRDAAHTFRGYEYGAVDYLVKPFDPGILRSKVAVFIELFLRREQIRKQAELLQTERVARAAAEAKIAAREEMLAIVSHDLGNPITAAITGSELIQRWSQANGYEKVRQHADLVHRALERMHRLVNDLLDASRIEAGRLRIERQPHDVVDIVNQAVDLLVPIAAARSQKVNCALPDAGLTVLCDRHRIHQVLSNLGGNAIKFAPAESNIAVALITRDNEVECSVRDSGPGIRAADIPHIFDRYWQAAGQERRGLGLGLAIAKKIVEAHGGRIWVASQRGEGSTFYFTLPRFSSPGHDVAGQLDQVRA